MNRRKRRAAAATHRGEVDIDTVAAYFRNDTMVGISVSLRFDDGAKGRRFAELCETAMLDFDMSPPEPAIAWLTKIGREKPPFTMQLCNWIVATIHWLERRKHIQSDDYNGVMWMGTRDGDLIAIRHDDPSPENNRELLRHIPKAEMHIYYDEDAFEPQSTRTTAVARPSVFKAAAAPCGFAFRSAEGGGFEPQAPSRGLTLASNEARARARFTFHGLT